MKAVIRFYFILAALCCAPAWAASPSPTALPSDQPSVVPLDPVRLRAAFVSALQSEAQGLRQRIRVESSDLRASQKARRKEFEVRERDARKLFFKENAQPAKRREYVKDFISRRKALAQLLSDELKTRKLEHKASEDSLRADQKRRLAEFDAEIAAGRRPSDLLWPQSGR